MRPVLLGVVLLLSGSMAVADSPMPPQPFVDYALLLNMHAGKVKIVTNDGPARRSLDIGDGVTTICRGLEGSACGSFAFEASNGGDMGCFLLKLAATLRQHPRNVGCIELVEPSHKAIVLEMFNDLVEHFASDAIPPRQADAIARVLLAPTKERPSCAEYITGLDFDLFTKPHVVAEYISAPHLPVTLCGEKFPALDE